VLSQPILPFKAPPRQCFAPAKENEYNRIGLDYRQPMPRPPVRGIVIDFAYASVCQSSRGRAGLNVAIILGLMLA